MGRVSTFDEVQISVFQTVGTEIHLPSQPIIDRMTSIPNSQLLFVLWKTLVERGRVRDRPVGGHAARSGRFFVFALHVVIIVFRDQGDAPAGASWPLLPQSAGSGKSTPGLVAARPTREPLHGG